MKLLSIILIIFVFTSCATSNPTKLELEQLQEPSILKEKNIKYGQVVEIVTVTGKQYKFKVRTMTNSYIGGKNVKVPIEDIVSIEKKEPSIFLSILLVLLAGLAGALEGTAAALSGL